MVFSHVIPVAPDRGPRVRRPYSPADIHPPVKQSPVLTRAKSLITRLASGAVGTGRELSSRTLPDDGESQRIAAPVKQSHSSWRLSRQQRHAGGATTEQGGSVPTRRGHNRKKNRGRKTEPEDEEDRENLGYTPMFYRLKFGAPNATHGAVEWKGAGGKYGIYLRVGKRRFRCPVVEVKAMRDGSARA